MTIQALARGYIASGEFNGSRTPQHIQNQIVKLYCDSNNLKFVLSRAEYWINGSTNCQLWAALREGFNNIVFFSIWQLPSKEADRQKIYSHCIAKKIILHFATEQMRSISSEKSFADFEILIKSNLTMMQNSERNEHFKTLRNFI